MNKKWKKSIYHLQNPRMSRKSNQTSEEKISRLKIEIEAMRKTQEGILGK